jgi:hypothetical protein
MAIFDFLLGTPAQTQTVYDPRTVATRDMLLDRILAEMDRDAINVPTYFAPTPQQRYSGANSLLASLGLETVNPSLSLPTQDVGGVQAYSTGPLRDQIMEEFKAANPELYEQLTNPQPVNTQVASAPAPSGPVNRMAAGIAPAGAAYFSGGQYYRADGSGIGAGSDKGAGFSGGFGDAPSPSTSGYVNSDGFIDAPYPSGGFKADMGRLAEKVVGNTIIGKIGSLFGGSD